MEGWLDKTPGKIEDEDPEAIIQFSKVIILWPSLVSTTKLIV